MKLTKSRKIAVIAVLSAAVSVPAAFAILGLGDIVFDPSNFGKLVEQLAQMERQYTQISEQVSGPEHFPRLRSDSDARYTKSIESDANRHPVGRVTQSERDWAHVRSKLRQGAPPEELIEELTVERADKFNPEDYARRTVEKAVASLRDGAASGPER